MIAQMANRIGAGMQSDFLTLTSYPAMAKQCSYFRLSDFASFRKVT